MCGTQGFHLPGILVMKREQIISLEKKSCFRGYNVIPGPLRHYFMLIYLKMSLPPLNIAITTDIRIMNK